MDTLLQRIQTDPNVCFGRPTIRGTRIWVSLIRDLVASGSSVEEVLEEYPQLTWEDVQAAADYSSEAPRADR